LSGVVPPVMLRIRVASQGIGLLAGMTDLCRVSGYLFLVCVEECSPWLPL
jgi:hypothetical protein